MLPLTAHHTYSTHAAAEIFCCMLFSYILWLHRCMWIMAVAAVQSYPHASPVTPLDRAVLSHAASVMSHESSMASMALFPRKD